MLRSANLALPAANRLLSETPTAFDTSSGSPDSNIARSSGPLGSNNKAALSRIFLGTTFCVPRMGKSATSLINRPPRPAAPAARPNLVKPGNAISKGALAACPATRFRAVTKSRPPTDPCFCITSRSNLPNAASLALRPLPKASTIAVNVRLSNTSS